MTTDLQTLVRHEGEAPRERSICGWPDRLISREDSDVAAWVHALCGNVSPTAAKTFLAALYEGPLAV
jgi:hypothetical protein